MRSRPDFNVVQIESHPFDCEIKDLTQKLNHQPPQSDLRLHNFFSDIVTYFEIGTFFQFGGLIHINDVTKKLQEQIIKEKIRAPLFTKLETNAPLDYTDQFYLELLLCSCIFTNYYQNLAERFELDLSDFETTITRNDTETLIVFFELNTCLEIVDSHNKPLKRLQRILKKVIQSF